MMVHPAHVYDKITLDEKEIKKVRKLEKNKNIMIGEGTGRRGGGAPRESRAASRDGVVRGSPPPPFPSYKLLFVSHGPSFR